MLTLLAHDLPDWLLTVLAILRFTMTAARAIARRRNTTRRLDL